MLVNRSSCNFLVHTMLICVLLLVGAATASDSAQLQEVGMDQVSKTRPSILVELDNSEVWTNVREITDDELSLWRNAVARLGNDENVSCRYTRYTAAPCDSCSNGHPMAYIEAMLHSLTVPEREALAAWFDAPVTFAVDAWVKDRFDPNSPFAWELVSMNGSRPDQAVIEDYRAEKSANANSRANKLASRDGVRAPGDFHPAAIRKMFDTREPDGIAYSDASKSILVSSLDKTSKIPREYAMQNAWVIDVNTGFLTAFFDVVPKRFSPHFGLRVSSFIQRGTFKQLPDLNISVVEYQEYSFDGRLTLVFSVSKNASH